MCTATMLWFGFMPSHTSEACRSWRWCCTLNSERNEGCTSWKRSRWPDTAVSASREADPVQISAKQGAPSAITNNPKWSQSQGMHCLLSSCFPSQQAIIIRVKYTLQPSTRAEVRFSTFNYETGLKNTLQLSKPDKFGHRLVSKAIFYFRNAPKFYIIFLSISTSSNEKTQNYKVVDLVESDLQLWYKKYFHLTLYK